MKQLYASLIQKIKLLSPRQWQIVSLLATGVLLKSFTVIFWEIGSVSLLLMRHRFFAIGIDLIGAGCFMSLLGLALWKIDRNKGYGSVRIILWCILAMTGLLLYVDQAHYSASADLTFMFKYLLFSTLTILYWAVAKRFIREQFKSLKFLSLFCLEIFGFGLAGFLSFLLQFSAMGLLITSLFCCLFLALVLKGLILLSPRNKESFTKRTDGIQNVFDKPLVSSIFTLSFFGTLSLILAEAVLYSQIIQTGISPVIVLGLLWALFGLLGLITVAILYHTRYIYTTLAGMVLLGLSVIGTGIASFTGHSGPVASCFLMFLLWMHFYFYNYLRILPRVLTGGIGTRLKKKNMTLIMPLAFLLCGSICLNLPAYIWALLLVATGIFLLLSTLWSANLYAHILYRMFEMRVWRNGPIIISYPRLIHYLNRLLHNSNADDTIYALRTLENANHADFVPNLVKALSHPAISVRRFAAIKIRTVYRFYTYLPLLRKLFHQETHIQVKNELLTDLILSDSHPEKYSSYLNNRVLNSGAMTGFLILHKDELIFPYLKKLLQKKDKESLLVALKIVKHFPNPCWAEYVLPLLKHPAHSVVRKALMASGKLRSPLLLPSVIRALDDAHLQEAAELAMRSYGKILFPTLEKVLMDPETPNIRRKNIVLFLGVLPSGEGKLILLRSLKTENQKLRKCILQNLIDSAIIWTDSRKKDILQHCLQQDIQRISWLLHIREKYHQSPTHEAEEAFEFFNRAIMEDIVDTRELILYQLLLLESNEMYQQAIRILLGDTYELYLPALGAIQDMLSTSLYQKLKPVLILPLSHHHSEFVSDLTSDKAAEGLAEIIIHPSFPVNHWIRATALYVLRKLMSKKGIPIAESALSDIHPVVLEAAVWTLVRLEPDKEKLHQCLLNLPTSKLARISLDEILES